MKRHDRSGHKRQAQTAAQDEKAQSMRHEQANAHDSAG